MKINQINSEKFDTRIEAMMEIVAEIKVWNQKASTEEAKDLLASIKEALCLTDEDTDTDE